MKVEFMNGYKVFSFETKDGNKFLVLDAIVPDVTKNTVHLQGFVSNIAYPFTLYFPENFPKDKLLTEALEDGSNNVKEIEGWKSKEIEISLMELSKYPDFLKFIRENCKSEKLSRDIISVID